MSAREELQRDASRLLQRLDAIEGEADARSGRTSELSAEQSAVCAELNAAIQALRTLRADADAETETVNAA